MKLELTKEELKQLRHDINNRIGFYESCIRGNTERRILAFSWRQSLELCKQILEKIEVENE